MTVAVVMLPSFSPVHSTRPLPPAAHTSGAASARAPCMSWSPLNWITPSSTAADGDETV